MDKNKTLKWVMFAAFVVLLVGGINYLFIGIFEFDIFGEIFGMDTIAGRVIFTLFGLSATILAVIVIYKSFYMKRGAQTSVTRTTPKRRTAGKTSQS